MTPFDAASILGLEGQITPKDAKQAYHNVCKKFHPDINPAGEEMMKLINQAYDVLQSFTGDVSQRQTDYADALSQALNCIISIPDLIVEICGSWVWVTGNTQTHKDILKGAGFKWAPKKKAWYFRPEDFKSRGRGKSSLEDIRIKYGSVSPNDRHPKNRLGH
ncbi:MAG: J domain-containing protein [Cyclobacteriaceae bacterium]